MNDKESLVFNFVEKKTPTIALSGSCDFTGDKYWYQD